MLKSSIGMGNADTRTMVSFPGIKTKGGSLILCAQYPARLDDQPLRSAPDHGVLKAKVEMRIEQDLSSFVSTSETALPGGQLVVVFVRLSGSDERGAVLIIVALMMSLLLGVSALAIDIGFAGSVAPRQGAVRTLRPLPAPAFSGPEPPPPPKRLPVILFHVTALVG